jgi:hypothetical protein
VLAKDHPPGDIEKIPPPKRIFFCKEGSTRPIPFPHKKLRMINSKKNNPASQGDVLSAPAHPKKTELRASNHHVINLAGIARDTTTAMGKNKRKNDRLVKDMLDFKTSIGKRDAFYCFR